MNGFLEGSDVSFWLWVVVSYKGYDRDDVGTPLCRPSVDPTVDSLLSFFKRPLNGGGG